MAQTSSPQRSLADKFQLFSLVEEVDAIWLKTFSGGKWRDIYTTDLQRRGKMIKYDETNPWTKTPENAKLLPMVPNAPIKARKTTRKLDLVRKKLEYTESKVNGGSTEPEILSLPVKTVPSSENDGVAGGTKNPVGKQRGTSQRKGGNKLANCDKENDSSLANRLGSERGQVRRCKYPTEVSSDFAHIRI